MSVCALNAWFVQCSPDVRKPNIVACRLPMEDRTEERATIDSQPPENPDAPSSTPMNSMITLPPVQGSPFFHRVIGLLVITASLVIYYTTTCPVIYFGDAGEFIVAAWKGGVAHPPGYPGYIILLAIFLRLPLGGLAPNAEFLQPIAWQANFFSAVISAFTVWIIFLILLRLLRNPLMAVGGAMLAAFSRTFWSQAGIAEVYALNALLLTWMTLIAIVLSEEAPGSHRRLVLLRWGSVVWGLSLSNHHEAVFFAPLWLTMAATALVPPRKGRMDFPPVRALIDPVIFLLIGLLPYLYLPIAASLKPVLNWGDPSSWDNFIRVLTRADYQQIKADITGDLITSMTILGAFLRWSAFQYFPYLLLLSIPGWAILFRKSPHRPVIWATAFSIVAMSFVFIVYFGKIDRSSLFFLEVYFIPWYLAIGVMIAYGTASLFTLGRLYSGRTKPVTVIFITLLLFLGAYLGRNQNREASDMSDNLVGYIYSHDILATLPDPPEKTILVTGGDEIFLFWYWNWVEEIDRETAIVSLDALGVSRSWYWDDLQRANPELILGDFESLGARHPADDLKWRMLESLIRENRDSWRTWMTSWDPALEPLVREGPWHMVLDGPTLELEWDSEGNMNDYPRASVPEENYLYRRLLELDRRGLTKFEHEVYDRYATACYNLALYFERRNDFSKAAEFASLCLQFNENYSPGEGNRSPTDLLAIFLIQSGDLELARETLLELVDRHPGNSLYHYSLAEIYVQEGNVELALMELETAMSLDPDNPFISDFYNQLLELGMSENEQEIE